MSRINRRDFITGLATSAGLGALAAPVDSLIGEKGVLYIEDINEPCPYVPDGLVFLGEAIAPPSSGIQAIDLGVDIDKTNWTIDWCGIHPNNVRSNNFMIPGASPVRNAWVPGWWVNADGVHINGRLYYYDVKMTTQKVGEVVSLANAVEDGVVTTMYAGGEQYYRDSSSLTVNAISRISGTTFRYIVCPESDYCYINSLRIYDRALTAEEVAYNHQIDQERFGAGL